MALTFDPAAATVKDEPHWRPTNQWRPRSLTSATARARYLQATKMAPDPQSRGRQAAAFMDASFLATQLANNVDKDPGRARVPHHRQGPHTAGASHHHHTGPTQLKRSDGDQREHRADGMVGPQGGPKGGQEKVSSHKTGYDRTEHTMGSPQRMIGHNTTEHDQAGQKTGHDKTGHDKAGYKTVIGHKTGHDKTEHDKTGHNKTGTGHKTGPDKTWHVMERSRNRVSPTRTARPVQKEALRPSVLTLGDSDTADSLRVTPRCHSADRPSSSSSRHPITTLGRSTGSPYLEDQQANSGSSSHHHHHHHHQPHHRHHSSPRHRPPQHYHHQAGRERNKSTAGTSPAVVKVVSAAAPQSHRRRHDAEDPASSPGRCHTGGDDRAGRCQASNTPFYKAALALMQAQRLRAPGVRFSPSPSSLSTCSSSSPLTSPRSSVFYLPPPPPPPPPLVLQQLHSPRDSIPQHRHHHSPHDSHRHPGHGRPKSILRPPPSPVPAESRAGWNSRPLARTIVHPSRSAAQSPFTPRPSEVMRVTPRKKVTFGNDVIVRLQPHVELSGRAMSSSV